MFRIILIILITMLIVTVVFGEDVSIPPPFPQSYLPEDFIYEVVEEAPQGPIVSPEKANPVTLDISEIPRTSEKMPMTLSLSPTNINNQLPAQTSITSIMPVAKAEDLSPPKNLKELADFGVLDITNGGFDEALWADTTQDTLTRMIKRLSAQPLQSATAQNILRRLLLTRAIAPEASVEKEDHWLAMRANTLLTLGFAEDAYALVGQISQNQLSEDESLAQVWTNTTLLAGYTGKVCKAVHAHVLNSDIAFWKQALATCQALQGQADKLTLTLSLVPEAERIKNPLLYQMLKATLDDTVMLDTQNITQFTPFQATILVAYPSLLNIKILTKLPDMALRRIMKTTQLPFTLRLSAAEYLVNLTARTVDAAQLSSLYQSAEFKALDVADPIANAQKMDDKPLARALLWQAAKLANLPSLQATALKALWQSLEDSQLHHVPSFLMPHKVNITPNPTLAWIATDTIYYALQQNDIETARAWWRILNQNQTELSKDILKNKAQIALSMRLFSNKIPARVVTEWWKTLTPEATKDKVNIQRVLSTLEAAEVKIPTTVWQSLYETLPDAHSISATGPGPMWLRLVADGLQNNRKGYTALLLIEPFMHYKTNNLAPLTLANVVTGLKYIGLKKEVKYLTLELLR